MKNKAILFLLLALIMSAFVFTGCKSTAASIEYSYVGDDYGSVNEFPLKDFTTLGLVFTEATLTMTNDNANNTAEGDGFIYQALLKEAKALNADTIINVTIDTRELSQGEVTKIFGLTASKQGTEVVTKYGSALAIKYGDILTTSEAITSPTGEAVTTITTTKPVFGGDGSNSTSSISGGQKQGFFARLFNRNK